MKKILEILLLLGGKANYSAKVLNVAKSALIGYWPLWELSGTTAYDQSGNGYNGTYTNGPVVGQAGIGDGRASAYFDGNNDFVNLNVAGLNAAISGATGTLAGWGIVSAAGIWTDGSVHNMAGIQADATNNIFMGKYSVDNQLRFTRKAGGSQSNVIANCSVPTTWTHYAVTWDTGANQFIAYFGGTQFGTTQTCPGTFTGTPSSQIGALVGTQFWSGNLAHVALWNVALTPTQIAALAVV